MFASCRARARGTLWRSVTTQKGTVAKGRVPSRARIRSVRGLLGGRSGNRDVGSRERLRTAPRGDVSRLERLSVDPAAVAPSSSRKEVDAAS
jgi:hypothetical protein